MPRPSLPKPHPLHGISRTSAQRAPLEAFVQHTSTWTETDWARLTPAHIKSWLTTSAVLPIKPAADTRAWNDTLTILREGRQWCSQAKAPSLGDVIDPLLSMLGADGWAADEKEPEDDFIQSVYERAMSGSATHPMAVWSSAHMGKMSLTTEHHVDTLLVQAPTQGLTAQDIVAALGRLNASPSVVLPAFVRHNRPDCLIELWRVGPELSGNRIPRGPLLAAAQLIEPSTPYAADLWCALVAPPQTLINTTALVRVLGARAQPSELGHITTRWCAQMATTPDMEGVQHVLLSLAATPHLRPIVFTILSELDLGDTTSADILYALVARSADLAPMIASHAPPAHNTLVMGRILSDLVSDTGILGSTLNTLAQGSADPNEVLTLVANAFEHGGVPMLAALLRHANLSAHVQPSPESRPPPKAKM